MYASIGDSEAQQVIRERRINEHHCSWLRRDPNACDALPDGIDGASVGDVCPHNVYHHKADVFGARDAAADTLERIFRLIGAAEAGLHMDLDILSVTELLAAKSELNKQEADRMKESRSAQVDNKASIEE